jgi:nucleotide-binding universal stress UspA family protein
MSDPAVREVTMEKAVARPQVSIKRILYATDFSRQSAAALPYALSITRKHGAKLFAVHVVSPAPLPTSFPTHAWQAVVAQAIREARATIQRLEPQWKEVPHETRVCRGDAWTELSKIVQDFQVDLIVLGTHGRTGASKALLGSVAEKVFRHSQCPVLTVGPNVSGEPDSLVDLHSILCPLDFSPESLAALRYAISLARQNQARLYLLHVIRPESDSDEGALLAQLRELVPAENQLSCEPMPYVQAGAPAQEILELAEELAVDLIVLGPKRRSGFPGSMATAYRVATQAICPVLTVRG